MENYEIIEKYSLMSKDLKNKIKTIETQRVSASKFTFLNIFSFGISTAIFSQGAFLGAFIECFNESIRLS